MHGTPCKSQDSRTILLAEDEPTVRKFVRTLLQDSGFTVLIAEDGLEALEKAKQNHGKIDLLFGESPDARNDGDRTRYANQRRTARYEGLAHVGNDNWTAGSR